MNKINKNDNVRNINPINLPYGNRVLPANTEMIVYKATRDGMIYCSPTDRSYGYGSIVIPASEVQKIDKPLPTVKVGDVFVSSWGYDQTNIDYYIVRSVKKASVVISPLGQTRNYTGSMQGECVPNITQISDRTITKRIQRNGSNGVCLKLTSYSWAYPWNGQTNHFTEWA
jgi:hypothetical protein